MTDVEFVAAAPLLIETEPAGGVLSTTTVTPFVSTNVLLGVLAPFTPPHESSTYAMK